MKLSQMNQSYDLILSMGYNCQPALHMRDNLVRSFTGPLDWVITNSILQLINQLENGFVDYMKMENLKIIGSVYGHFSVEDTATSILSFHDFPVPQNGAQQITNYSEFRMQLDRRIERFYKSAQASKKALYVRHQASVQDAVTLRLALERISGGEVYLLIVNYSEGTIVKDANWDLPFIAAVEIPITEPLRADAWKQILSGIVLSDKS